MGGFFMGEEGVGMVVCGGVKKGVTAERGVSAKAGFAGLGDGVYYEMETVKDGGSSYYEEAFAVPHKVCKHNCCRG